MQEDRNAEIAGGLRMGLYLLIFLGLVGVSVALAYERHWDGVWQLVPWATLGIIFLSLVLLVIWPAPFSRKLARWVAMIVIVAALLGTWHHFNENYQTASLDVNYTDTWESMSTFNRVWVVAKGSAGHVPVYAAGILVPIGLALVVVTTGLGERDGANQYLDPRQRR